MIPEQKGRLKRLISTLKMIGPEQKKRLMIIGGVVLAIVLLLLLAYSVGVVRDKEFATTAKPATPANPAKVPVVQPADPPATASAFQRIEETVTALKTTISKGLADISLRVEALEKKSTPRVVARVTGLPTPQVPAVPATTPPPTVVDLTSVERGLNRIADQLSSLAPIAVQTPAPEPSISEGPLSDEERARRYWEQYQRSYNRP
ncbi:MAG: hypothetical protein Q7R60_00015 [bacterium]|nr:hypothetical protein [bacterium]